MAREVYAEGLKSLTMPGVGTTLIAKQYLVMGADNEFEASAGAGGIGILQNKPKVDESSEIAYAGISKAKTGAAVTVGARVTNDSSGRVIDATSGTYMIGWAMLGASNADELISVLLTPGGGQLN